MVNFKTFLAEYDNTHIEELARIIKRDCAKWLEESEGRLAYRGFNYRNSGDGFIKPVENSPLANKDHFLIGSVRKDREPKDSPQWLHDALNEYFISKTGIPVRSASLFCVGHPTLAGHYGPVYAVFPIGDFNYTWSKLVADPTHTFYIGPDTEGALPESGPGLNKMIDKAFKKFCEDNNFGNFHTVQQYIKDSKYSIDAHDEDSKWARFCKEFIQNNDMWVLNTGLSSALSSKYQEHEIMVVCDKYYLVSNLQLEELEKIL